MWNGTKMWNSKKIDAATPLVGERVLTLLLVNAVGQLLGSMGSQRMNNKPIRDVAMDGDPVRSDGIRCAARDAQQGRHTSNSSSSGMMWASDGPSCFRFLVWRAEGRDSCCGGLHCTCP